MLVSFSVSNFRSIKEEQTLSMVASKKIKDHPEHLIDLPNIDESLVRTSLLYGANAAGKSNFVNAMQFAQSVILGQSGPTEPFRFLRKRSGSSFEFRFLKNGYVFTYGFDITGSEIQNEWLSVYDNGGELLIFERKEDGKATFDQKMSGKWELRAVEVFSQIELKKSQLFLSRLASIPADSLGFALRSVLEWLTSDLKILNAGHRSPDLIRWLYTDQKFRRFSSAFLNYVDTGISDLEFEEIEREWEPWEKQLVKHGGLDELNHVFRDRYYSEHPTDKTKIVERRLSSSHEGPSISFMEESDGTQQLIQYLPVLSHRYNCNTVFVIDELDRSLHPLLCWEVIKHFSETGKAVHKQLIVTTHESHLLNQDLLRRDEYWFVEKDKKQQTQLVPLSDFKIRNDLMLKRGYLNGRFGGIPVFGSLADIEKLLDCSKEESVDAS